MTLIFERKFRLFCTKAQRLNQYSKFISFKNGKMLRSHILPAHLLDVSFLTDETCFRLFGGQNVRCLWFSVSLWS